MTLVASINDLDLPSLGSFRSGWLSPGADAMFLASRRWAGCVPTFKCDKTHLGSLAGSAVTSAEIFGSRQRNVPLAGIILTQISWYQLGPGAPDVCRTSSYSQKNHESSATGGQPIADGITCAEGAHALDRSYK